jgi:hypothetical protein
MQAEVKLEVWQTPALEIMDTNEVTEGGFFVGTDGGGPETATS